MILVHADLPLETAKFLYQVKVSLAILVSLGIVAALLAVSVPLGLVAAALVNSPEFVFIIVVSPFVTLHLAV